MTTVLVTGFHRSGTSALARALHGAGLDLGASLLGAEPANPHGHFEDENCVALHDELLKASNLTWKSLESPRNTEDAQRAIVNYVDQRSELATSEHWGVKDPRMCIFLADWLGVVPDAHVVFALRPPGPAIASLLRRHVRRHVDTHGIDPSDLDFWRDPDLATKLWCHYHERALPALTQHKSVTIVRYEQPDRAEKALSNVADHLNLNTSTIVPLDRSLGVDATATVHDSALIARARNVWNHMTRLSDW